MEHVELSEQFAAIRRVLREVECFDMKMFAEIGGYGAYVQIENLNLQAVRYRRQIASLEERLLTLRAVDNGVCACETHGLEYLKDDVWLCGYCKLPIATNA
jgi:hypothetical protein